ncbi:hypothetical protein LTS18_006230 [Coniosporium uncinatum]|uniref:Uncharacterized protein n=1 Tax=Coniosporium uncinatum TaxID=93489 RepID=A0ACC3DD59_9PEZI|nr:hypothetical protein LTS18_006230 [Coniosporium uncinatum]
MSSVKQIETSLLTEHLRYTPITLLDDIINTVNELVNRAVDAAEEGLLAADPATLGFAQKAAEENITPENDDDGKPMYPESRTEIEEGVHKLETLLEANIDRNFDKLEIYVLRNVLCVPDDLVRWVRLAHYDNLSLPSPNPQTPPPSPETLHHLRKKLLVTRTLHTTLLAEQARNAAILSQLQSLLSTSSPPSAFKTEHQQHQQPSPPHSANPTTTTTTNANTFTFLASTPSAQALGIKDLTSASPNDATAQTEPQQGPLAQNTAFTLSQLPSLKRLLATLRPALTALPQQRLGDNEAEEEERREYIETQTMKIVERRGMRAGQGDGAGSVNEGRRMGWDEVEALEGIAGAIGKREEGEAEAEAEVEVGMSAERDEHGDRMEE